MNYAHDLAVTMTTVSLVPPSSWSPTVLIPFEHLRYILFTNGRSEADLTQTQLRR